MAEINIHYLVIIAKKSVKHECVKPPCFGLFIINIMKAASVPGANKYFTAFLWIKTNEKLDLVWFPAGKYFTSEFYVVSLGRWKINDLNALLISLLISLLMSLLVTASLTIFLKSNYK